MSKPGITMVAGSSAGFHLSGFGGMGLREVSAILERDPSQAVTIRDIMSQGSKFLYKVNPPEI